MKLGLDSNGFSFPLKVNPTLREATGCRGRTRTSHKAQRRAGQIALVMSQEDSLQGSAYRAGGSSGQGPSNAEKALPSPVIGSVGKRDTVNLRQEQVAFPLSFPILPTLTAQIQTTSGEGDAPGWKAAPLTCYQGSLVAAPLLHAKGKGAMSVPIFFNSPSLGRASQPPQIPSSFHTALFSQVPHRVWGDLSLRPASPSHINMRTPLL